MKRILALLLCLLLALAMFGCGGEEAEETETGAVGHPEEVEDTTRMDSAMETVDSLVGEVQEAVEEAAEEAVEEVTEEATGH
jgi:hypothetical protein